VAFDRNRHNPVLDQKSLHTTVALDGDPVKQLPWLRECRTHALSPMLDLNEIENRTAIAPLLESLP
jgi:hypothetical protein